MSINSKKSVLIFMAVFISLTMSIFCFAGDIQPKDQALSSYETWKNIGSLAAGKSLKLMKITDSASVKETLIVLTNAGYAEVNGASTQGALDGLADVTGASRGKNTLLEIHSTAWNNLWFAVYEKNSGHCAY